MTTLHPIFNKKSNTFLIVTSDNRIHLWDVDTRKERRIYVERNHLSHVYTCCSWNHGKKDRLGTFAIGTSDGKIVLWDLIRGVVRKTITISDTSSIPNDIAFSNDGSSLFSISHHNQIIQYNVETGETINTFKSGKKGSLKLAMNPKANVFAIAK